MRALLECSLAIICVLVGCSSLIAGLSGQPDITWSAPLPSTPQPIALSSDGNYLVAGGQTGVCVYRMDTFAELWLHQTDKPVTGVTVADSAPGF